MLILKSHPIELEVGLSHGQAAEIMRRLTVKSRQEHGLVDNEPSTSNAQGQDYVNRLENDHHPHEGKQPSRLSALVKEELRLQPQLRQDLFTKSYLNEPWKASSTTQSYRAAEVEVPTGALRRTLIKHHKYVRLWPYHPRAWLNRSKTLRALGYGELAAADAYKATELCSIMLDEVFVPLGPEDTDIEVKVREAIYTDLSRNKILSGEDLHELSVTSAQSIERHAMMALAEALVSVRAVYDALDVLKAIEEKSPGNPLHERMSKLLKHKLSLFRKDMNRVHGQSTVMAENASRRGTVHRVEYPWIDREEFKRSNKAMKRAKTRILETSKNAVIDFSSFGGAADDNHGVLPKQDIRKHDQNLAEKTCFSRYDCSFKSSCSGCCRRVPRGGVRSSCCNALFCTETCMKNAQSTLHRPMCGDNFEWLYEERDPKDSVHTNLVPIVMVKVLAAAVQQKSNPLKVASASALKPNLDKDESSFRLYDNVVVPIKILEALGVDIFVEERFDSWALQTLYCRIEDNIPGPKL